MGAPAVQPVNGQRFCALGVRRGRARTRVGRVHLSALAKAQANAHLGGGAAVIIGDHWGCGGCGRVGGFPSAPSSWSHGMSWKSSSLLDPTGCPWAPRSAGDQEGLGLKKGGQYMCILISRNPILIYKIRNASPNPYLQNKERKYEKWILKV